MKIRLLNYKRFFCIFYCCCYLSLLNAQETPSLAWAKSMGGSAMDIGYSIAADTQGNVYVAGDFRDTAHFNLGTGNASLISSGDADIFVAKTDPDGNLLWAAKMGGKSADRAVSIAVDDSGSVYIAGRFSDTADLNPGTGVFNLVSKGNWDIFVLKLDRDGNFVWAKSFGGTMQDDVGALTLDGFGNVYITGLFRGIVDFNPDTTVFELTSTRTAASIVAPFSADAFVAKFNIAGDFIWAVKMGGTGADQGNGVTVDQSGNVYVTGIFNREAIFDVGRPALNITSKGGNDVFVAKLDSTGVFEWTKSVGGSGNDNGVSIVADALGNTYTTGIFLLTVDFDPGTDTFNLTSLGGNDVFVLKLNNAGEFVWAGSIEGRETNDNVSNITIDSSANIYVTGMFYGSVDFNPDSDTFNLISNNGTGGGSIFAFSWDSTGQFVWAIGMGGTNSSSGIQNRGYSIAVNPTGTNIYTTGHFQITCDFDPGPDIFNLVGPVGQNQDIFIQKLCMSIAEATVNISGPDSVCINGKYTYSADVPGALSYTWQIPDGWKGSSTTNKIEVEVGKNDGVITVIANGACDSSAPQSLNINLLIDPIYITVNEFVLGTGDYIYESWQWFLNGQAINGANSSTYEVKENGEYCVVVTKSGCTDTACYMVNNVSVDNIPGIFLRTFIHPNPAKDIVHIESPLAVGILLTGADGRILMREDNVNSISVSNLARGIYFLSILDSEGKMIKVEKVVKQ